MEGLVSSVSAYNSEFVYLIQARKQTSYQHPEMYNSHPLCDRAHKLLDPIILSGSDAQVLLILAYGISFHLSFKCSISAYHYNVVLHVIFAGCATFTLSILFVHKYFENLITAGLRLITMIIILSVYGTFLRIQSASFDMYRIIPDKGTSDSILFLPAICLLDAGPSTPGDDSQQANPNDIMRNLTYLLNTFFATAVMIHAIPPISYKLKLRVKKGLTIKATCGVVAVKTMLCIVLLVLIGLEWSTIMQLRNWVDASGWMNKDDGNPEMDTMGIGQLVPLMALAAIAIPISDKVSEWLAKRCCWGEFATEREDRNYIELERRNQALSWVPPRD